MNAAEEKLMRRLRVARAPFVMPPHASGVTVFILVTLIGYFKEQVVVALTLRQDGAYVLHNNRDWCQSNPVPVSIPGFSHAGIIHRGRDHAAEWLGDRDPRLLLPVTFCPKRKEKQCPG